MAASSRKVVYAFQILKRDLFCMYVMRNLKKDGSKYNIIYPNHNFFRDTLLGKLNKTFSKTDVY